MYRRKLSLLLVVISALTLVQCRKKALDDYYGRPETLEPGIYKVLEDLKKDQKKDTLYQRIKLNSRSTISGMEFQQQVEKVEDYVFMVKVN